MKRIVVVAILVMLASGPIVAEDITDNWSSYFEAGDTSVSLGVGFGAWSLFSIATYPGIEQTIMDFKIADVVPMSIGAAIKGVANIYAGSGYAGVNVGAGLFVPFHFSLRGLDIPLFNRFDIYVAPGIGFNFDLGNYYANPFRLGFVTYDGFNYFVNDSFAVFVEGPYWDYYSGATIGVLLKL